MLPKKKKRRIKNSRQAVLAALKKTAEVATGQAHFENDFQARSALTLARLGKDIPDLKKRKPSFRETMPHLYEPKFRLMFKRMDYLDTLTEEQHKEWDRKREEAYAMLDKQRETGTPASREAEEYFRKGRFVHISVVEEALWPPHLRFDTLGLDPNGNPIKPEGDENV